MSDPPSSADSRPDQSTTSTSRVDAASGTPPPAGPAGPAGAPAAEAPGLREQLGRTKDAVLGLVAAHVKLARAEISEIAGEIKKVAMLGGVALGMLMLAGLMATLGGILWLDEWLFGSIGWGALHGTELFLALTILPLLAIIDLRPGRAIGAFVIALVLAIVATLFVGASWRSISDQAISGVESAWRPWVLAVPIGIVGFAILGLIVGAVAGGGARVAVGLVLGIVFGLIFGIVGAMGPNWWVASAVGVAVLLLLWPLFAAALVFRHGIDTEALKDRFLPDETIKTTKETIEWVRAQTPLGPKS